MNNKIINKCFVCKKSNFIFLFKKNTLNYVKCNNCGTIYINPREHLNKIQKIYNKDYFKSTHYYLDYLAEEKNIRKLSKEILSELKGINQNNKNILEVGCATGFFLSEAKKRGYNVEGIEISKFASDYAKKKFNINVYNGTIENFKTKNKFNVIVLLDVIEHVLSIDSLFKRIKELCENDSILIISTPITDNILVKTLKKRWIQYRPEHLIYFNRKSIQQYLINEGFSILKTGYLKRKYNLKSVVEKLNQMNKTLGKLFMFLINLLKLKNKSISLNLKDVYLIYAKNNRDY